MSVLQAISKDKAYTFNSDVLLHLREPDLAGMQTGGWGIPQAFYCYGTARYLFGLRKMNEILASDYMIPMRVMSPEKEAATNPSIGVGQTADLSDWNAQARGMIASFRKDPAAIHTISQPVKYQLFGAEGKSLVPGELLLHGEDMLLNAMGISPQLYRGDLNLQTAPMAARLLESNWQHLVDAANTFLRWVQRKVSSELGWKPFGIRLTKPLIADNMDQLMLLLQLMPTGKLSDTTLFQALNKDYTEELRRVKDDTIRQIKNDNDIQREADKLVVGTNALRQGVEEQRAIQQQQMAGPQGAPAGPPPADPLAEVMARIEAFRNPDTPVPITEQLQLAEEAAALIAPLPLREKRQKLRNIEQINPPIADLIRSQLKEVTAQQDAQFIEQGRAAMQQQQGGMPM
jgi:hypothetical protein